MSPLPLLLVALVAVLGAAPPAATTLTTSVWHHALVTQDQLAAAAMSTSYQVVDEMICAILANNLPWCHLFTHEGNTCVLYDVVVDSLTPASSEDTATPCKTRHRNVCIVEGVPLAHGDTLVHDCLSTTCWNRALVPTYAMSSTCDAPFFQHTLGCVYLHHETKNWCEARIHCSTINADLAVVQASDFVLLQSLLDSIAGRAQVWVGVKARKWLDGRDVTEEEWTPGNPDGDEDDCARMTAAREKYQLADMGCAKTFKFLCMKSRLV